MKDWLTILSEGIDILCGGNKEIERIFTPRKDEFIFHLKRYIKEIELFNSAYGLVGANDTTELITKHILDSLAPLGLIIKLLKDTGAGKTTKIADVGSGAGLPGIPLAIVMPQYNFTLIERMGRRVGFLLNTKAVLSLSNVIVEEGELEKTENSAFNLITFRALKSMDQKLIKTLLKKCAQGGIIAAYKGRRDKIETEMASLQKTCENWEAIQYTTPFLDEERHLLVIKPQSN